jgi:hypothetical protein
MSVALFPDPVSRSNRNILPEFGVRSEINLFRAEDRAIVTGEIQQAPVLI